MFLVIGWSVQGWVIAAGIPAAIYAVQNYCTLMAYQVRRYAVFVGNACSQS
jgi:hypothetical protein